MALEAKGLPTLTQGKMAGMDAAILMNYICKQHLMNDIMSICNMIRTCREWQHIRYAPL